MEPVCLDVSPPYELLLKNHAVIAGLHAGGKFVLPLLEMPSCTVEDMTRILPTVDSRTQKQLSQIARATQKLTSFMYLFMGVLWGHFSSSNSPGILAQELDIHICVNEISFQGVTWLSLTCQTVIGHITLLCVSASFPTTFSHIDKLGFSDFSSMI